jgi:hypothetical protein
MTIFACDFETIEQAANVQLEAFGQEIVETANGAVVMPAYHFQARLIDEVAGGSSYMTPWTDIRVFVMAGEPSDTRMRLSGIWPRHVMYFANVPDNTGNMYISDTKDDSVEVLPDVDVKQARPPRWDLSPPPMTMTMTMTMSDDDQMDID